MANAIELKDLTKHYTGFTLGPISFTLPAGCIMGFIGENGAGKSTAIKSMLGLVRPDRGEIRLLGKDPRQDRTVMEDIGTVLDAGFFPPELKALELERVLKHMYKKWDSESYHQYLRRFQLDEKRKISDYSRGMVMKLSLAAALAHKPKLLLLDEATSGLDPMVRDDILDILLDFIQDEEHSVFLSSHITGDLEKIADYIVFLHQGKIIMNGEKDALLDSCGILKCSRKDLDALDPSAVLGFRNGEFGATALVRKYLLPDRFQAEPATLDDIMLYSIKGSHPAKEEKKQ